MRHCRFWRLSASAGFVAMLGALAAGAPACSLVYELDADQCSVDADCRKFGAELPLCRTGVCVAVAPSTGGSGGDGGGTSGGTGGDSGGSGGTGGSAAVECADTDMKSGNSQCIDEHFGQPYLCIEGSCVKLTTDECPLVVGAQNLSAKEPIVFGAYANAPDAISRSAVTRNIELVVSEFTSKVTGLRGGVDGTRRTLAFVVCHSQYPEVAPGTIDPFLPSLTHLVDTLHVPGIVSALSAKDMQAVFEQKLGPAGTFVISPFDQDSELAKLTDDGRLWHMLGATSDLAPAFAQLLKRTDAYLRSNPDRSDYLDRGNPLGTDGNLRVALVTANIARELDIRDALDVMPELDAFNVEHFLVESALLTSAPDVSAVSNDLLDFAPNIIVALAGSEFIEGVFPALEGGTVWNTRTSGQLRPMYVLGSTMAPETWSLYSTAQSGGGWGSLLNRIVGVAYASAEDSELLENYETRLTAASGDLQDPSAVLGFESVYDATYLMIYATAAVGDLPTLTGQDLATGMRQLVAGTAYNVGPMPISDILNALENATDIGLRLTLGEPNWNVQRGTRTGLGSVYCLNNASDAYEQLAPQGPNRDVLRYNPEMMTLEPELLLPDQRLRCIDEF